MTLDTMLTGGNAPTALKRRNVVAKFDITKFAKKDAGEPDADDKKKPAGKAKGGKFKAAYSAKFGKG